MTASVVSSKVKSEVGAQVQYPLPKLGGKEIPHVLYRHIFSFGTECDSRRAAETCRGWSTQARWSVNGKEIADMIGDQTKAYAVREVIAKIKSYFARFPNIRELNLRSLQLDPGNKASEHFIPMLLRFWGNSLDSLRLPVEVATDYPGFINRVMYGIFHDLPEKIRNLDLRLSKPATVDDPLEVLEREKIDASQVTQLHWSNKNGNVRRAFSCFPKLETLDIVLSEHRGVSVIAEAINAGQNLQNLRIQGLPKGNGILFLEEGDNLNVSVMPRLRNVELVNVHVTQKVVGFFKRAGVSSLQLSFTRCSFYFDIASFSMNPEALRSFH